MTVLNPEIKQPEQQNQQQVDTNLNQNKSDTNLTQPKVESEKPKTEETPEDPNWKAFREARKKDRAEREAAEKRALEKEKEAAALKAAMEAAFSNKAPSPQAYQQYYGMNQDQPEEDEEQRIERKVNELLAKKEEQYRKQAEEDERVNYPKRLMKDMPDFSQICTQENLDYLDYHFPEISRPLQRLNDGYDKWYDTYHAIKKFIPNYSSAKQDANRAALNTMKPKSIASATPSPTGNGGRESMQDVEARRAANWERMQRTMKGI